jgi:signal transduction histidine kinase
MGQGLDLVAQRADGSHFPIEVSLSAIQSATGMQGVAFIADISERVQAEKQRQDLLAEQERINILQKFVVDIAHDLKTPMASMMTRLYILNKVLGGDNQSHLDSLAKQIQRLNQLIDAMLVMTRLDATDQLEMERVNLNGLVEAVLSTFYPLIERKQQQLQYYPADDLPDIMANQDNLFLAVENIIKNAAIFTPEKGTIIVRTYCSEAYHIIEVTDNGIGIAQKDLPSIFNRLYRVDEAREMNESVNGLGLAIVKRIMDLHNGRIEVESERNRGSTFKLILPAR